MRNYDQKTTNGTHRGALYAALPKKVTDMTQSMITCVLNAFRKYWKHVSCVEGTTNIMISMAQGRGLENRYYAKDAHSRTPITCQLKNGNLGRKNATYAKQPPM